MAAMVRQQPQQPAALYATALWQSSGDDDAAALATLHRLPTARWDSNMHELADRRRKTAFGRAGELRARGDEAVAIRLLQQQPACRAATLRWPTGRWSGAMPQQRWPVISRCCSRTPATTMPRSAASRRCWRCSAPPKRAALHSLPDSVAQQSLNSGRRVALAPANSGDPSKRSSCSAR